MITDRRRSTVPGVKVTGKIGDSDPERKGWYIEPATPEEFADEPILLLYAKAEGSNYFPLRVRKGARVECTVAMYKDGHGVREVLRIHELQLNP